MTLSPEESSATLLPARQVFIKTKNSLQALRTGLTMPAYTIRRDAPWIASEDSRDSMYSEDEYGHRTPSPVKADLPPHLNPKSSYSPSYNAQPQQQIEDHGPQVRQSKLPIFKQVRNILQKPGASMDGPATYGDSSADVFEPSKPAQKLKPSTKPYEGFLEVSKTRSHEKRSKSPTKKQRAKRDFSPVSILHDDDLTPVVPLKAGTCSPDYVSPIPSVSPLSSRPPTALSANERVLPSTAGPPKANVTNPVKRKPTPSSILGSSQTENRAPSPGGQRAVSGKSDWAQLPLNDWELERSQQLRVPNSRFSWSSLAGSTAPDRLSAEMSTSPSKSPRTLHSDDREPNKSHFSWSTVNTTITYNGNPDSAPSSPMPSIPEKYASQECKKQQPYQAPQGAAYQSIVSRPRPVPRPEETFTPRKSSMAPLTTPDSTDPVCVHSGNNFGLHPAFRTTSPESASPSTTVNTAAGTKSLPAPPAPTGPQSHLEKLEAEEQNLQLRRHNAEKAIRDLEKVEKASPMDVSFAAVREAREKLKQHRENLADILKQERSVGISISRARRKEGMEEGLWVRRVVS